MTSRPPWAPDGIDLDRPSAARMYDFYLGGSHNFAADRRAAEEAVRLWPELPMIMRANRGFLGRAVRYLARRGIDQFVDLGAGIPTFGCVHEIAREVTPAARVVYVDRDPVAVAHSRALLQGDPRAAAVRADVRDVGAVIEEVAETGLVDLQRPVGLLMIALLHFVTDQDDPAGIIAGYRDAVARGSYLALSHASAESDAERVGEHEDLYARIGQPITLRGPRAVREMFDGWGVVEPGVVSMSAWGQEADDAAGAAGLAGVARLG